MKRLALTVAILVACAGPCWAEDHAAEQQVLDAGRKPSDLFQSAANPFDLEIDFTVQNHGSMPGRLSVKWQAKDHWWSKVVVGGFYQTTIRNGEMEYTVRSLVYTPNMIWELFQLISFDEGKPKYPAVKQKDRTVDGVATTCVETQNGVSMGRNRNFCFGTASHELLREDWEVGDRKNIETFADYSAFDGVVYPRKFQLLKNGEESISASVTTLESAAIDPALLVPTQGAIERRKCDDMKPPVPIRQLSPSFSLPPGLEGQTTAAVTVLADGSVGDIQIMHSGGSAMDKLALEVIKKYRFKPAMCGSDPVVTDTEIEFNFRHN
jgi:TonB family protein